MQQIIPLNDILNKWSLVLKRFQRYPNDTQKSTDKKRVNENETEDQEIGSKKYQRKKYRKKPKKRVRWE